jgi:hypothetical protein
MHKHALNEIPWEIEFKLEPMAGIEPATDGLRIRYNQFATKA